MTTDKRAKALEHLKFKAGLRAPVVIEAIVADIRERSGLGDEWNHLDEAAEDEIRDHWHDIVLAQLEAAMNEAVVLRDPEVADLAASHAQVVAERDRMRELILLLRPSTRHPDCWCVDSHDRERLGHTVTCLAARVALGLVPADAAHQEKSR